MVFFIFILLLMFSLSGVLYLMVRALPRVAEEPDAHGDSRRSFLDRWAHSEIPEKIDASLNSFLLKFLRKFKVFVLKLDNVVSAHLKRVREVEHAHTAGGASANGHKIDFKEIAESKEELEK